MGIVDNALIGASGQGGYFLSRSLRFRRSASAYLSRTPATTSGNQIFTMSAWVKRGQLGAVQTIMFAFANSNFADGMSFMSDDTLEASFYNGASSLYFKTTQVFRDPSAWYHIVFAVDTTQATSTNRFKVYVNGAQVTAFSSTTYPVQNLTFAINSNCVHTWGVGNYTALSNYTDFYTAELNWITGQQLTPSSFGSTNLLTGVWQPARYTGTYGTNGFYLPFTDNSALTTSSNVGLGKDFSGNGNYWTTNNISITAGATYDSMTDVPTLTSATAANFAVGNPLAAQLASSWNIATMQAGNLNWGSAADNQNKVGMATMSMTSGKYYWEITIGSNFPSTSTFLGITKENQQSVSKNTGVYYRNDGQKVIDATSSSYGASYTSGDVIGLAYDATAGTLVCYKNNSSQGTLYSSGTGFSWIPTMSCDNAGSGVTYFNNVNFGQRPFAYTPPTGFVALNTFNLPTSTIVKGNTVMDATLYTGNGSTQTITNAAGFKPDLVWVKSRSATTDNKLTDSVRGVTKGLVSNTLSAETTDTNGLTAFNSNGWSLGTDTAYNNNAATYVGWQWQAGQGSTSSNTNGTITSTVSVNAAAGFSVVTYTGTGANATVGHGLGVAPSFIITKSRTNSSAFPNWNTYHSSLGAGSVIYLAGTSAAQSVAAMWNNTSPTSSVFSVGTDIYGANISAAPYVAYCWTPIAGYSAFGSYTGNSSTNGPFVYLGFRPKYLMIRRTDDSGNWLEFDSSRDPYNAVLNFLRANATDAEATGVDVAIDFVSNGFKLRQTSGNINAGNILYIAFAENPFKNALAR